MLKDGEKAAVLQRDKQSYAIVPHFSLGLVTAEDLRKVADVADKYNATLKITSAARIAMVGFKEEDIDPAWKDLGIDPGHAVGLCVRSIKACPGTTLCRLGKQDAIGLGKALDERYHGFKLPNKCKIGVSGCINNCAETPVKDLGFVGKPKGWTVMVGGNAASRPQLARELVSELSDEQALEVADKVLNFFAKEGKKSERIGRFIDRIGFDAFKEAVL
ncbi:MAG: NAD(P)/FAD-dependent oxidoreductase [Desulfobulbaceae bacterium]|nr:NAD(P)/FAD-dependent oxidoreductase [Desulfobulbaceae bacterium]